MKKHLSLFILALCTLSLFAQSNDNEDGVVKIERYNRNAYREGQVIVKFRPESAVRMRRNAQGKLVSASVNKVTDLLNSLGFDEADELMPLSGNQVSPRKMHAFIGEEIQDKNLSKLYCFRASKDTHIDMYHAIEQLQALDEIEFAEPNYIVYALASDSGTYVSEPLYSQQWGPAAIGLPALWNKPKITTKRPVIAIIDTGVDIEHPDLAANIWTNEKEANGVDGEDDDNNGFVDDIHGWDFVNQTSKMADYNGHGTHCAGIAATVGDNGIGITGANPDALIMPIVVLQSDGTGDMATIIKGIDYATANGADVISMSFGTYSNSIALEQSLAKAYSKAVLVAAAGNDGICITAHLCPWNNRLGQAMFPAAFQFVLGVEASDYIGNLASFSNYDDDGPIQSAYFVDNYRYNYELRAPGVDILSTFPKGRYRLMAGTSMACPLVAGAISRLMQCKEYSGNDVLFADLIHARENNVDIMGTYDISDSDRYPALSFVMCYLTDSLGDNDNRIDAGDTLALYPILRNTYGTAHNIRMWGSLLDTENDTIMTFLKPNTVEFGSSIGSYATMRATNPINVVIDKNCANGRHIQMLLYVVCENMADTLTGLLTFEVENGVEIGGMLTKDMTLHPNVQYIVTSNIAVPNGVTLTIEPGTILRFKDNTGLTIAQNAHLIAKGKPDSLITFTKAEGELGIFQGLYLYSLDTIEYCAFHSFNISNWTGSPLSIIRVPFSRGTINGQLPPIPCVRHCTIFNNKTNGHIVWGQIAFEYNNIYNNITTAGVSIEIESEGCSMLANNICMNWRRGLDWSSGDNSAGLSSNTASSALYNHIFANFSEARYDIKQYGKFSENFSSTSSEPVVVDAPQYWGSNREDIISEGIWDLRKSVSYCYYDLSKRLSRPSPLAHGIVWKVVVNGYDAQDEFEQLPPLGVGRHKFEVYFNRAMDTLYTPTISMGVRSPYTQISIAEDGHWSADSTIYTAYLNLTGSMATDGLCRIYVADAKDDERFDIPTENTRFNVQVSAAGSMSAGFMAQAGLGKVYLEWNDQDANIADVLGYNMYRYTVDTLGQPLDTIRINHELIDDTLYTDFEVTPGTTYYYYYKVLRTDLQENSPSHTVVGTPLTASKGDANGSMTVDVADVVTEIAYLTNDNPQPFIFEAADVNSDSVINILDVVGTINIIIHPQTTSLGFSDNNTAIYTIEDGILYVETPVVLGGVQFTIIGNRQTDSFQPLEALQGFEQVSNWTDEETYTFLAYSMSGKTLGIGKHALLRIGDATLEDIVLSNPRGQNVPAIQGSATAISVAEAMQMQSAYPNPFTTEVVIPYIIGQTGTHNVHLVFTNVAGLVVDTYSAQQTFGEYTYTWRPAAALPAGVYFVTLYVDDKALQVAKLVRAAK